MCKYLPGGTSNVWCYHSVYNYIIILYICVLYAYIHWILCYVYLDEDIDGGVFVGLTNEDIDGMFRKIGVRKKLKQLQSQSQPQVCILN